MKKRIAILAGLLAISIAGQFLLRPCLGNETGNQEQNLLSEQKKDPALMDPNELYQKAGDDSEPGNMQGELYKQLIKMIAFVGIVGAGAWFYCKKMPGRWNIAKGKDIVISETVNLGPRKHLHIVQIGTKQYLLSSTADTIRLLADVTDSLEQSHE